MRLHENKELFRDAITFTAQHRRLPEIYIEKDYWVTFALRRIFEGPSAKYTVIKGGTALSKCFTYINRFSEDIDLVVVRDVGMSANRLKDRLKQISNAVSELIPEVVLPTRRE
jgi:predicted nucleotidyltransferase component of viral defense system